MKSLIAVPTYNERENIESLVADIHDMAPGTDILIIDDNSPDGTGALVDQLAAERPYLHAIHRPGKLGLGTAYVAGFRHAIAQGYDLVFEMDADYSHHPRYLPEILRAAEDADLVIGSRYVHGGGTANWSVVRKFVSGGGNAFARVLLRIPTHDCTGGFRCYRTAALRTIDLDLIRAQGYAFQVEMAYIFWKRGYRVREVPIIFEDRRVGKSKMSRKIFIEAFVWVLRTRLRGDRAASAVPPQIVTAPADSLGTALPERTPDGAVDPSRIY
ncbi:MAG: polyprenol monophosphomannose synthase [Ktedonobacterales bacterium]